MNDNPYLRHIYLRICVRKWKYSVQVMRIMEDEYEGFF